MPQKTNGTKIAHSVHLVHSACAVGLPLYHLSYSEKQDADKNEYTHLCFAVHALLKTLTNDIYIGLKVAVATFPFTVLKVRYARHTPS